MQKRTLLGVIASALLLVGAGCNFGSSASNEQTQAEFLKTKEPVKIGVMLPLTGDAASYGESVKKAIDLAVKGSGVTLAYEDSKCDGKEAVSAMNKLVSVDHVSAVIGELCSGATLAAAPVAEQNKVVVISPASSAPTLSDAGEYIFRTIPSDALQGSFGAKLVARRGYKRLAVLYSNEDYGNGFNKVLTEEFPKQGGTIVASEAFEKGATDVKTQITKIKNAKPDAIYIVSNSVGSNPVALKQIKEQGLKVALFGSEGLRSDEMVRDAKGAAEGLVVTSVSGGNESFVNAFKTTYNEAPGTFAAQAYDAMKMLSAAVDKGATSGEEIKNELMGMEYDGVSGHIKFDANGDVAGNYDVFQVTDGKYQLVK